MTNYALPNHDYRSLQASEGGSTKPTLVLGVWGFGVGGGWGVGGGGFLGLGWFFGGGVLCGFFGGGGGGWGGGGGGALFWCFSPARSGRRQPKKNVRHGGVAGRGFRLKGRLGQKPLPEEK